MTCPTGGRARFADTPPPVPLLDPAIANITASEWGGLLSIGSSGASSPSSVAATASGRVGDAIGDGALSKGRSLPSAGDSRTLLDAMTTPAGLALEACKPWPRVVLAPTAVVTASHDAPPAVPPPDAAIAGGATLGRAPQSGDWPCASQGLCAQATPPDAMTPPARLALAAPAVVPASTTHRRPSRRSTWPSRAARRRGGSGASSPVPVAAARQRAGGDATRSAESALARRG
jgi:hypothetical protein